LRTIVSAVLVGVLYYVIATPAAQMEDGATLAAIAWPAPTFVIAILWRRDWRDWPYFLSAVFIAMMWVGDLDWLPPKVDAGFALLNVVEVALCAWLGRRFVGADGQIDTLHRFSRFLLLLPLAAVALIAALGATLASLSMDSDWWHEWRTLLVGNGLAILVLVPGLLAWSSLAHGRRNLERRFLLSTAAVVLASMAAWILSVYLDASEEVLRVSLSLILVAAAIYGGMRSAALTMGISATLGVLLTLYQLGPYRHDGLESAWRLQVDLAGLAVLSFFVAIAVRERQQMAVRLEQMRRFESLGLLAGGIAHDFNNVLGAVGGYAEMAHDRIEEDSPARPALQEVISAVLRGRDLTEQILLAARRGDRHRSLMDIREAVAEAVRLARPLCRQGVVIELELPDAPVPVQAHRNQLTRAVLNLVRNASQAAGSRVSVALRSGQPPLDTMSIGDLPADAAAWLEVQDDGPGIAAEHMARLFDPFFSTKSGPGGQGTGLGLAIVAGVATEHEGGVSVASSSAGTRFRLLLPLDPGGLPIADAASGHAEQAAHAAEPAADEETPPQLPGNGERIAVVDDDNAMRELNEDWLAELGFEPIGYGSSQQALTELSAELQSADGELLLLLTDLDMPYLRGDDLITRLRAIRPGLPVILCSAHQQVLQYAAASDAVALHKPYDRAALQRAIMTALKKEEEARSSRVLRPDSASS
jgi:signal transduction histidine kinase